MRANLSNDLVVKNLPVADKPYYCMSASKDEKGFGLIVYPSGSRTFVFRYKLDGKQKLLTIGEYPKKGLKDARAEYLKAFLQVKDLRKGSKDGADPVKEVKAARERRITEDAEHKKNPTVEKLVEEYLKWHAKLKKKSWQKDEAILNRDVIPAWGKRKSKDITKRDVLLLLEGIVDRGAPAMANNCFQIIRKMFNFAVERDVLPHSPCSGLKLPAEKKERKRALSNEEILRLWQSLSRTDLNMSAEAKNALKLILVTAQRPGEVLGMHSSEVDGSWWTIPAERVKNKRDHRVFLTQTALGLIGPLKVPDKETGEMKPKGFIFRTPVKAKEQPMGDTALAVAVGRNLAYPLTDAKGNPLYTKDGTPATENRLGVDRFTPHDLRRTAATLMAQAKIKFEHRERVLNHTMGKLDRTYNQHDYDEEKQIALETLERKVQDIIGEKQGAEVIPITAAKTA